MKTSVPFLRTLVPCFVISAVAMFPGKPAFGAMEKEIGAYVQGVWKPQIVPQVSIVLFRWGDSGEGSLTTKQDRMLGQVASRGQREVVIVMRTPPKALPSYEVRLTCGVQICGEGVVVQCGECPFSRKYNGSSLVSRGAYNSNICCFDVLFGRIPQLNALHIVDVIADGESVPYMVKFNVKPTILRSGTKVPIPPSSRLHPATIVFEERPLVGNSTTVSEPNGKLPPPM